MTTLHWKYELIQGRVYGVYVADTPFGPIWIESRGEHWVCTKHPKHDYKYLNMELSELTFAQAKAEGTYFRTLERAVKQRDLVSPQINNGGSNENPEINRTIDG